MPEASYNEIATLGFSRVYDVTSFLFMMSFPGFIRACKGRAGVGGNLSTSRGLSGDKEKNSNGG